MADAVGLMWWIDRWRKSTAYTDLTLEEQGAYRNLLDEAFLRGGPLPNDERILAKASGDATSWKRLRDRVIARFRLTPDGWRNDTLDAVVLETKKRIEKQQRYRDGKKKRNDSGNGSGNAGGNETGNASGNAAGNEQGNAKGHEHGHAGGLERGHEAGNERGYLDQDQDRERSEELERSRPRARVFAGKRLKVSAAQQQLLLDEVGDAATRIDLPTLYRQWDETLVASGETFDTLEFLKRRMGETLRAIGETRESAADDDWFDECHRLHDGRCNGRGGHRLQLQLDQARLEREHSAGVVV